jgi:hypothetical protein
MGQCLSAENLDTILKDLAKEFCRINGKHMRAEIILVGGAAVIAQYGFRECTQDIDAVVYAASSMKDAASRVGDKYGLPYGWFNSDFTHTTSYTGKLEQYSRHYRTYSNIVEFRVVPGEYLVAMKLMAGRPYKHDLSDVAHILEEQQNMGTPFSRDDIVRAVTDLYGGMDALPENSIHYLDDILSAEDLHAFVEEQQEQEMQARTILHDFEQQYDGVLNEDNLMDILSIIRAKEQEDLTGQTDINTEMDADTDHILD